MQLFVAAATYICRWFLGHFYDHFETFFNDIIYYILMKFIWHTILCLFLMTFWNSTCRCLWQLPLTPATDFYDIFMTYYNMILWQTILWHFYVKKIPLISPTAYRCFVLAHITIFIDLWLTESWLHFPSMCCMISFPFWTSGFKGS